MSCSSSDPERCECVVCIAARLPAVQRLRAEELANELVVGGLGLVTLVLAHCSAHRIRRGAVLYMVAVLIEDFVDKGAPRGRGGVLEDIKAYCEAEREARTVVARGGEELMSDAEDVAAVGRLRRAILVLLDGARTDIAGTALIEAAAACSMTQAMCSRGEAFRKLALVCNAFADAEEEEDQEVARVKGGN